MYSDMAGDDRDSAVVVKSGPPTSIQHFVITMNRNLAVESLERSAVPSCTIHTLHTLLFVLCKTPAVGLLLLTLRHEMPSRSPSRGPNSTVVQDPRY